MLHLSAALAAAAQADHDTTATHLDGATALAARMDIEVGTWADWRFGSTKVGIRKTSIALELREPGQAIHAAKTVHPELLPNSRQAQGDAGGRELRGLAWRMGATPIG